MIGLSPAILPIPLLSGLVLAGLQLRMLQQIAKFYDVEFSRDIGKSLIATLVGSGLPSALAISFVPVVGRLVGAVGMARILLRPEQIDLDLPGGAAPACTCRIEEVEFGGASSLITLRVQAPDGSHPGASFVLRRSGLDNMRMGETVALRIDGTAHAFPKLT